MAPPRRSSAKRLAPAESSDEETVSKRFSTRRSEIIAAFRTVLIREGQGSLSMRRIADECDMKLGNLQYYFPTRDDLIDAFVEDWIRLEQLARQLLLSEKLTPMKAILKWIDDVFTHLTRRRFENGVAMLGLWELSCHDDRAQSRMAQWYQEQCEYYGSMVLAAKPQLNEQVARERAAVLMALYEGLVTQLINRSAGPSEIARARMSLHSAARAVVLTPPVARAVKH